MDDDAVDLELDAGARLRSWLKANNLFEVALGNPPHEWDGLQEDEQAAWLDAFAACQKCVAEANGSAYDALARIANVAFQRTMNPTCVVEWSDLPATCQLKWKFLVRHMVNLLLYDSEDDGAIQQHEEKIGDLFADHLKLILETSPP
jgi:hypothetical protein